MGMPYFLQRCCRNTGQIEMSNAMRYRVEFEGNDEVGYSTYLPELPGCVAEGGTFEETQELIAEPFSHPRAFCIVPASSFDGGTIGAVGHRAYHVR